MTDLKPHDAEPSDDDPPRVVDEARERLVRQGYTGRLEVSDDRVFCCACRSRLAPNDVRWRAIEIVADANRMIVVGGIRCPVCKGLGVATTFLDLFER